MGTLTPKPHRGPQTCDINKNYYDNYNDDYHDENNTNWKTLIT